MDREKRFINEYLERKAFEDIIKNTFQKYRDNLMCSQEIMDSIINDATKEIREQLQGMTRKYIKK